MPMTVGWNEVLGVALLRPASPRRVTPPRPDHCEAKHGVDDGEDPQWSLVIQDALYPVLDEADRVASFSSLYPKPRFQDCERAVLTKPGLQRDHRDGEQMGETPPELVRPRPTCPVPDDDDREPQHDEQNDSEVQEKNGICKCLIGQRRGSLRRLTLRLTGARKEAKPTGARPVEPRVRPRATVSKQFSCWGGKQNSNENDHIRQVDVMQERQSFLWQNSTGARHR